MNAKKLAVLLAQRAEALVTSWYPEGFREGEQWRVGNVQGERGRSLNINLSGDRVGYWFDFATGEKGDLLELWRLRESCSLHQAIQAAQNWLGISSPQFYPLATRPYQRPKALPGTAVGDEQGAVWDYLTQERKLNVATLKAFQIHAQGRQIIFPYWREGELLQVKYLSLDRVNGKKQIRVEANCEPCLFGWQALSARTRRVTLTEGEIDAMTLHQYGIPALSVPFGGGQGAKQQWLDSEFDRLSIFDEIYLCLDNDTAGQEAVAELIKRLGSYRCKVVNLPHKDANACLQQGLTQEQIKTYFRQARLLDPEELKPAAMYSDQVIKAMYPPAQQITQGMKPPWDKAKDKILFRQSELSIWTGVNGHGKSQFLGQIALHTLKQEIPVCIASLELPPARLLVRMARQAAAMEKPSPAYIQAIHDWYSDKLWLFDLTGTAKTDRLLEVFLYARQRYNVTVFIIDSLMKCGISEDDYTAQKLFVEKLCDFKNQHDCHIHLIAHPRKSEDEKHMPGKYDIKGTGAIVDLADNCFTVWRNKSKEQAIEKTQMTGQEPTAQMLEKIDCLWGCDKQRNGEWEGKIGLWFDKKSFQYLDYQSKKPTRLVEYSCLNNNSEEN